VIRRCRAVTKLGPGGVQNWAGDVIAVLREAHRAVEAARARGDTALGQQALDGLRERYDTAVDSGIIHNRLRDWDTGNHPGYALGTWLRDYKEEVFLFTRNFAVSWTWHCNHHTQPLRAFDEHKKGPSGRTEQDDQRAATPAIHSGNDHADSAIRSPALRSRRHAPLHPLAAVIAHIAAVLHART
jgi:hypothetical protein